MPLVDESNTFKFFESMTTLWNSKSKYLGKVKIRYSPDSASTSSDLHIFVNEASFLEQIELNFENSLNGALTLYFMKETGGGW